MNKPLYSFRYYTTLGFLLLFPFFSYCQDSSIIISNKIITLKEVVVRNNLNVPGFIERVQKDTSFYKAFKNLRVLGFTALNDIRMLNKKGAVKATLQSKTRQSVANGCRSMQVINETTTGDIYDRERNWNYYTAELYAGVFFARSTICHENNIVGNSAASLKGKSGIQKHKEQLKMLLFNPGSRIPGIPFIGNKVAIFEDKLSGLYDYTIDMDNYQGQNCYLFIVSAREDLTRAEKNDIVIKNLTTWFDSQTMEIVARNYQLDYDAGVFDFDVHMQVELTRYQDLLVPKLIRYSGNWHAILKKRETGIFTATLFDFGTNL
jgi:hypothetical protein